MEQSFGGPWTLLKLEVLDNYLNFYIKAIGNKFKLCYIDAFAGSGVITVKGVGPISGHYSGKRGMICQYFQYRYVKISVNSRLIVLIIKATNMVAFIKNSINNGPI